MVAQHLCTHRLLPLKLEHHLCHIYLVAYAILLAL